MSDLFDYGNDIRQLGLAGADVSYKAGFLTEEAGAILLRDLIEETPWRQENVTVWGKTFRQPRLIAWYGDPDRPYSYSGITLAPLPWTPKILQLRVLVQDAASHEFNSVLLNYYRDQNDSMGMHSDDEKELGPTPTIASVSLGAERIFIFKSKIDPQAKSIKMPLASGSLLLMKGETQKNHKHGISKETRAQGPRINLTFRKIIL